MPDVRSPDGGGGPPAAQVRYDHVQPGGTTLAGLGFGVFVCFLAGVVALTSGREGERVAVAAVVGLVLVLLAVCMFVFRRLRVVVTDSEVVVSFGSGWPRRRIPLGRIGAARPVRNSWWYGWGIRFTPHGWLWNVSGFDAVELELLPHSKFRIGTDDPAGLLAAIESAKEARRG